jgi:hypothetical protein
MNELKSAVRHATAYGMDFCAWSADQARRLRDLKPAGLDWENLAEEIESLGKSDRRAVGSALKVVLEHLLKWRFQPAKRSPSWSDSIEEHRDRISRILEDSPSLASLPAELLEREHKKARRKVLRDTGLSARSVPIACPFTADQILDPDFWPDAEETAAQA